MHGCVCKDSSTPALLTSPEIIMRTLVASEWGMRGEGRGCADRNSEEMEEKLNQNAEIDTMRTQYLTPRMKLSVGFLSEIDGIFFFKRGV